MNLTTWLYLTDLIHNIDVLLGIFFIIFLIVNFIFGFVATMCYFTEEEIAIKMFNIFKCVWKRWFYIMILFLLLIITPSQKTMYLMLGSSFLSQSNLPTKVSQVLELKLDDIIKDLTEKKKDKE